MKGSSKGYGDPAVLHALDPTTAIELYNSNQAGNRDLPGFSLHFATPMVANGKVYLETANELDIFGLLPTRTGSLDDRSKHHEITAANAFSAEQR